jgi:hypothetical protein
LLAARQKPGSGALWVAGTVIEPATVSACLMLSSAWQWVHIYRRCCRETRGDLEAPVDDLIEDEEPVFERAWALAGRT